MRVVTCMGDARSARTHSGAPYYFWRYGERQGFIQDAWRLAPERLRFHRLAWNLVEWLRTGSRGGFQYSTACLDRLLAQAPAAGEVIEIISLLPLFPPVDKVVMGVSFYIDATIAQVLDDYGAGANVSRRIANEAVAREREQYAAASRIICMCHWAARSVVERYDVPPEKVHVIPAGANLDDTSVTSTNQSVGRPMRPLRLGFIGKEWRRKNLPLVLDVAEILASRGYPVEVAAIGFSPGKGPRHPLLRAYGFLDKQRDMAGFVEFVRSLHFGCLFSVAEAFGLANVECLRLGVPVLTWDVGGLADTVQGGLGHLFPAMATAGDVADLLEGYLRNPETYNALRGRVAARAKEFSWNTTVARFVDVWAGTGEYSVGNHAGG